MPAEARLYQILSGYAPLAALVGDHIWPDALPEDEDYPAVVYSRESTDPTYNIGGQLLCEDVTFNISAFAVDRDAADAIAVALRNALQAAGAQITEHAGGYDPEAGVCGVQISAAILVTP